MSPQIQPRRRTTFVTQKVFSTLVKKDNHETAAATSGRVASSVK